VGPCAAGKTTLVSYLLEHGWDARQCQQEHSYVPDMWRRISRPAFLVYLDVSRERSLARKLPGPADDEWTAQRQRLQHARLHCDLFVDTDPLSILDVRDLVLGALAGAGLVLHGVN
jgi:hypothetical protein